MSSLTFNTNPYNADSQFPYQNQTNQMAGAKYFPFLNLALRTLKETRSGQEDSSPIASKPSLLQTTSALPNPMENGRPMGVRL